MNPYRTAARISSAGCRSRSRFGARQVHRAAGRDEPLWESLETRQLLTVELSGTFTLNGTNVAPGASIIDIPLTVTNSGDAASDFVPVRFVLSTDNTLDDNDVILSDFTIDPIGAGADGGSVESLVIPSDTPVGSYFLLMIVDPDNQIAEGNENDNVSSTASANVVVSGAPVFADLSASLGVLSGSFLPTQEVSISLTVRNTGQAVADNFVTRIVLSRNNVFGDGDDIALEDIAEQGLGGLLPGDVFTDTGTVLIPTVIAPGTYFILAKIDVNDSVTETSETNNVYRSATASVVILPPPVVSIAATDASASETAGNGGRYTVTRTGPTTLPLSVNLVIGGTATPGDDYTPLLTTVSFLPGSSTATIDVSTLDDMLVESSETVIVSLAAGDGYTVSGTQSSATVTIADNEPTISVVATRSGSEDPATTGLFTFTRTGGNNASALTVFYSLLPSTTAASGVDFEVLSGSVTFAAGSATATVLVTGIEDQVVEPTETVVIGIVPDGSYRTSGTQSSATVNIADDEPLITVAATDAVAGETAGNTATFTFTRSSGDISSALTVNYDYLAGTATAGVDFMLLSGSVTFAAGSATATVVVTTIDDALVEPTETLGVQILPNASYRLGATITAQATILDNEATVTLTSLDSVCSETAGDTAVLTFTRGNGDISGTLTVFYAILPGGTANGADYLASPGLGGQITFAAGIATATITISGIDDSIVEPTETLSIGLIAQNSYILGASTSVTVSILDNEPTVTLVATDAVANETAGNTGTFTFTRAGGDISGVLTVLYSIVPGGTANGTDFIPSPTLSGAITFAAGVATATITITPIDDTLVESDETISLALIAQNSYSLGAQTTATITVQDNEPTVTLTASDPVGSENAGDTATFTFTRSGGTTTSALTILYTIGNTSTANGTDYVASPSITSSITIPAGAVSTTITITPADDAVAENDETLVLNITAQNSYRTGGTGSATVTILDNEPRLSVTGVGSTEGAGPVVFTLTRTGSVSSALTANFTLTGDAVMGTDYSNVALSAVFAAGQSTTTVSISVIDDALVEAAESIILTLVAGVSYSVSPTASAATATIADNEPTVSVVASTAAGSEDGPGSVRFTLTRGSGSTSGPLTVAFTLGGTATSGSDYTAVPLTATFNAGELTTVVTLNIIDDALAEATETAILQLQAGTSYRVSGQQGSATATIADNEPIVSVVATTPLSAEGSGTPIVFTFTRVGSTAGSLSVDFVLAGTAILGTDYDTIPLTATFAPGSATATVSISVVDDALAEPTETVILQLSDGASYHASVAAGTAAASIADNEPTISVVATVATLAEGAAGSLVFTLTRTGGPLGSTLDVDFTLAGAAIMGTDYGTVSLTATFAAGSATTTVSLSITDDALAEPAESVILQIATGAAYRVSPTQGTATATISDNEPTVSVTPTVATAAEGGTTQLRYTLTRSGGPLSGPLTVDFTFAGTAVMGQDFATIPLSVTFAAGSSTVVVSVTVLDDLIAESTETVILLVTDGTAYRASQTQGSATASITDNEPIISVVPTVATAVEGSTTQIRYTLTRAGGVLTAPLTVNFTMSGVALMGQDYANITLSATFAANATTTTVSFLTLEDLVVEPTETVILNLTPSSVYRVSLTQGAATATITDNEPQVSIAVTDGAAGEALVAGQPNTGRVTLTRTGPLTSALTVNYVLLGTATQGDDYLTLPGTVTFAAGAATATITITPVQDTIAEPTETVVVQIGWGSTYRIDAARSSATASITDDEPVVSVVATAPAASETGMVPARFTFTRTGSTASALTVSYSIGGTASEGDDYATPAGLLVIPAGQTSAVLIITPVDDLLAENTETIVITVASTLAYAASLTQTSATAMITDNEPTVTIAASDAQAGEGSNPGQFRVTRTGATTASLTVQYTMSGTAQNGTDYQQLSGLVVIPAGSLSATIDVTPIQDQLGEGAEGLAAALTPSITYRVGTASASSISLADDESVVTLIATTLNASEGGSVVARLTVTRTGNLTQAITVNYQVAGGSATPGADFAVPSGTVTLAAGVSTALIQIAPIDDGIGELPETAVIQLLAGTGYLLGTTTSQTLTITDNEPTVTAVASVASVVEGSAIAGRFTLTRSGNAGLALTVPYTLEGSATSGSDYQAVTGSVTFGIGQTTATVTIATLQDTLGEGTESVALRITDGTGYRAVNGNLLPAVSITDDEPQISVSASDARAAEGPTDTGRFTLTRAGSTGGALTVTYTIGGSAGTDDYALLSGSVTFLTGQTVATVTVTALADLIAERDETVVLTVTGNAGYVPGAVSTATVTIAANGPEVSVTALDAAAGEVATGVPNPGRYTITRTGSLTAPLTVFFHFAGSATPDADFVDPGSAITFAPGQASVQITLTVIDDLIGEPSETAALVLDTSDGYRISSTQGSATVTIADDEPRVTIAATDGVSSESGTDNGRFTVTRTGPLTAALVVTYNISGIATPGADYTTLTGTVTIAAGAASAVIDILPVGDNLVETQENVTVTLTQATGYALGATTTANCVINEVTRPDLTITGLTFSPSTFSAGTPGQTLPLTLDIANLGPVAAGAYTIEIRLSANAILGDADDIVLRVLAPTGLAAGGTDSLVLSLLLDAGGTPPSPGQYYLGARIDSGRRIAESNEANNDFVSPSPSITIVA